MKKFYSLFLAVAALAGCKEPVNEPVNSDFSGLLITEVAANADKQLTASWVEVFNPTSRDIDLTGLGLFLYDEDSNGEELTIMEGMTARAGERLVFSTADYGLIKGFASDSDFEIVLGSSDGKVVVDRFDLQIRFVSEDS